MLKRQNRAKAYNYQNKETLKCDKFDYCINNIAFHVSKYQIEVQLRERERVDFVYLQVVKYLRGLIFDRIFFETCVSFVFVEFLKMKLRNTIQEEAREGGSVSWASVSFSHFLALEIVWLLVYVIPNPGQGKRVLEMVCALFRKCLCLHIRTVEIFFFFFKVYFILPLFHFILSSISV